MRRRKDTLFPLSPSHRPLHTSAVIVSCNRCLTAHKTTGDESVVKSSWSHTQLRGLSPIFQRTGTVFLLQQFPHRKSIFLDRQRYSALLFKLNETAFFFGDKYCCYINLALNLTVSSCISRIKTIGGGC